jgi:hypothetical protein
MPPAIQRHFGNDHRKRWTRRLADHGGLKNYGVNFVRDEPKSSIRKA